VTTSAPGAGMSYQEYVALEKGAAERHEYINGKVFAMAGGTPEHGALAVAFAAELRTALVGKQCRVFSSDVAVHVAATSFTSYPDVSVVCGKLETAAENERAITNPVIIVEVLSPSTEGYDRGAKSAHFRQLESLRELVFVAQDERRIEVLRRTSPGHWELTEARSGSSIELQALGISLSVDAVYSNPLE